MEYSDYDPHERYSVTCCISTDREKRGRYLPTVASLRRFTLRREHSTNVWEARH